MPIPGRLDSTQRKAKTRFGLLMVLALAESLSAASRGGEVPGRELLADPEFVRWQDEPTTEAAAGQEADPPSPSPEQEHPQEAWSFAATVFTYVVPDEPDYANPIITADRGWLHLEARYNYEDLETGSLWIGYNLSVGQAVQLDFTPMLGGVLGETSGVAPGFHASLSYWLLEWYSEGEYLFDTEESSDSFFYMWTELTLSPVDWFRVGLAAQRTRAYESDLEVERGFVVGFTYRWLDVAAYMFNPDESTPTWVFSVGGSF